MNPINPFQISRRTFLRRCSATAAATGLPLWFVERELAQAAEPAPRLGPNDRPAIALIGCGGQGSGDTGNAQRFGDVVAVCDVDKHHVEGAVKRFTKDGKVPAGFSDFRKLLERDDIHGIINGTPDHWHSLVNIAAAKAKKDIYSEKPLTLTIDEGKHVVKAVRDHKVVLQTGTQQRSNERFRLACDLVRNNRIGKLKEVTVWLPAGRREGPFASKPVPPELDWDFWQGQAPKVDYVPERCHTWFRYWYEYSGGTMTDWGAHHMDIGYWAIGLPAPTRISSKALSVPIPGGYTTIADYEVKFTYPNGVVFNVRSTRDDDPFGGTVNPAGQRNGIHFEGADGWIWVNRDQIKATDRELLSKPLPEGAERLYVSNDHMGNFFDCMRSRKDPICAVEIGHRSASVCHLGAISLRTGKNLEWDPAKEVFTGQNAKEANGYATREMRKPYDYSFVG
ncbi:MAG: Gfo/Idh/MocA family oxidoreductase [Akkermansiaceae bacterium]|nr:Gfo/Idh/MocA family oxidoreductase [Akkermansiaceae bacterium]